MGAKSPVQEQLESELKRLIVATLKLEDTSPEEIDSEAPLGVAGLGLDSIDVLEVAVAIHKRFGIRTESDEEANRAIFSNVRALAEYGRSVKGSDARMARLGWVEAVHALGEVSHRLEVIFGLQLWELLDDETAALAANAMLRKAGLSGEKMEREFGHGRAAKVLRRALPATLTGARSP